jgi:S-(hydroxymethyl)glutathione synthase
MGIKLHPSIDNGITKGDSSKAGGKLQCKCSSKKVEVTLGSNVDFNHACGCSKCWKPEGALFSVVGVIPVDKVSVTANGDKLEPVDKNAVIVRNACKDCGVHMYGRIEQDHPFKGLDFVHVELSDSKGWQEPQFAAFVSSIIEAGFDPEKYDNVSPGGLSDARLIKVNRMDEVRSTLQKAGLQTYDCLSPALMDLIATEASKKAGTFKAKYVPSLPEWV